MAEKSSEIKARHHTTDGSKWTVLPTKFIVSSMTTSGSNSRVKSRLRPGQWVAGLALLVASCQTTRNIEVPGGDGKEAMRDPVFGYLTDRYDANEDGRISRAEYSRTGVDFSRLDRNEDGQLTDSDFARIGRRMRVLSPSEERRQHAVYLLGWYFQDDGVPSRLVAVELERAFAAYDADQTGRVGRTEFEKVNEQRALYGLRPGGKQFGLLEVETTDPWERILRGVDQNDDGFLTLSELNDFHRINEAAGNWSFDPENHDAEAGSLTGARAPDFTLQTVDGSRRVTLSDFAGDRPVALIFGSWT